MRVDDAPGNRGRRLRGALPLAAIVILLSSAATKPPAGATGRIELDLTSDYSHIRVRTRDNVRSLSFVRDSGQEVAETYLDLNRPHNLLAPYTRFMFLSYLFKPKQDKVLLVGLGGGAMVHFLRHYDPDVKIDVVEIDPAVVRIAQNYFGIQSEGNVKVITRDGVEYLKAARARYDVIYMDAFLKPSGDTASTGAPLRAKTTQFYKEIQKSLEPDGVMAINLNSHSGIRQDVEVIAGAFPQVYINPATNDALNVVVVATQSKNRETLRATIATAKELDRRFDTRPLFQDMAARLVP